MSDITTLAAKLKGLEQNDSGMFEMSDDLICEVVEALEAAERRVAELESRKVVLPDYTEIYQDEFAKEVQHQVRLALTSAGIKLQIEE